MANTFDASLVNSVLSQTALTKVQEKLAFLGAFTTDFSDEVRDQRSRVINVPFASAGSAVQVNPTDFESGDTTLDAVNIELDHISKSFYITSADYQNGHRLENLAAFNLNAVTSKIESVVFSLLQTADFGTAVTTAGDITVSDLKTLFGSIVGDQKIAILDDASFAQLLPNDLNGFDITRTRSGYGFDVLDRSGAGFASADTDVIGFGANPAALVMAAAIPQYPVAVADLLDSTVVEVPSIGLAIQSNIWASTKSRNVWASFDLLFGAAVGDAGAGKLVIAGQA